MGTRGPRACCCRGTAALYQKWNFYGDLQSLKTFEYILRRKLSGFDPAKLVLKVLLSNFQIAKSHFFCQI